jgi:hypothetical protein
MAMEDLQWAALGSTVSNMHLCWCYALQYMLEGINDPEPIE